MREHPWRCSRRATTSHDETPGAAIAMRAAFASGDVSEAKALTIATII
jgi:hypothetical protein